MKAPPLEHTMGIIGSKSCNLIGYRLRSGANQSMLARELQLYKARFGAKNIILSLVFGEDNSVAPSSDKEPKMASRDPNYEPEEDEGGDSEPTMVGEEEMLSGPINR